MGHKAGDNSQVTALAEALGWKYEIKRMAYQPWELISNVVLGATLVGIKQSQSSILQAPWPDLIVTAGRRNEPVARWVREQAQGKTKIVHLGRPWNRPNCFDLIVTTPQYHLPEQPNIVRNQLPLHCVTPDLLSEMSERWAAKFTHLPKPHIAVLMGGNSGPFVFTTEKGKSMAEGVNNLVSSRGGSVLVTNSARTPADVYAAFKKQLKVPGYFFDWGSTEDNPYYAYLALAEAFVVTGESMSMLAEANATGKPLYIFDLNDKRLSPERLQNSEREWWKNLNNYRFKPLSFYLAKQLGPKRMLRDVGRIQSELVSMGRATWLGEDLQLKTPVQSVDDLARTVVRVKNLF